MVKDVIVPIVRNAKKYLLIYNSITDTWGFPMINENELAIENIEQATFLSYNKIYVGKILTTLNLEPVIGQIYLLHTPSIFINLIRLMNIDNTDSIFIEIKDMVDIFKHGTLHVSTFEILHQFICTRNVNDYLCRK